MSHFQSFSNSYHSNHVADDSSKVFDADRVIPDEVPSLPAASQEESPQSFTSELLRRINSQRSLAEPSTATATRSEEISTNESSSSSSSKKRTIVTNSSPHSSRKKTRRSSRPKSQQPQDLSHVDKPDSEVDDENGLDEAVTNQSSSSSSSQTSTTKLNKFDARWKSKFEELRAYKQLHGHTSVPNRWRDNRQLGKWVSTQRTQYKKFKKNEKSSMTPERVDLLNSIDFEWVCQNYESKVAPKRGGSSKNESAWNRRFNELKAYKEEYKDTNVPQNFKDNKQLGIWVSAQRVQYKKLKENKYSSMTNERIQKLESIGFEWVSPNKGTPRNESAWNRRFNELKAYKEEYKDTNVPNRWEDNKELGVWVRTQRTEYKKFQEKKKSSMNDERIQMLESIGFQWSCR